jgi:hypothetical protein
LILLEGLTKDSSTTVRKNSAIGLTKMGPHTFRTIILGLYDEDWSVRRIVEKEIFDNYEIGILIEHLLKESSNILSLRLTIKDILDKELVVNRNTCMFFENLLKQLEQ